MTGEQDERTMKGDQMLAAIIAAILATGGTKPDIDAGRMVDRYQVILARLRKDGLFHERPHG